MAKSFNMSSFKSQVRQAQRKVERQMQSEINKATRKFESDVNRELRKYNSNVRRNQQIVVRELNKLRSSSSVQTKYTISLKAMHQHYTAIENVYQGLIETQSERMEKIISLIDQLIRYKLELSEVRRSTIAEMHMEGIEFRISTMAHVMRFKSKLQKELKRDTFEEEFEKLATFLLDPRDDFAMLKKYYLFLLTSETGDLSEIGIKICY